MQFKEILNNINIIEVITFTVTYHVPFKLARELNNNSNTLGFKLSSHSI